MAYEKFFCNNTVALFLSMTRNEKQLDNIAKEIATCPVCHMYGTGKPVPGEGNPTANIMFVGEAPGKQEAATGRPFIGRSGILLRRLITQVGLNKKDIYITSPVKYLPLRGTPGAKELAHGAFHLQQQLAVIQPKLIVLLGASACKALLKNPVQLKKMHGQLMEDQQRKYFITFHPAAALRFPPLKKLLEEDFVKLQQIASVEKL